MVIVSAKGLIKDYGTFRAVADIEFQVFKGECFGFLGPNGAGKTSVMRIIHCFMPPTAGKVEVFGLDVLEQPSIIKSKIGVMPQEDNLDIDLSVLENLIVYARYFDIPKKRSLPKAIELLEFLKLKDQVSLNIRKLSGGMKRKLLLARALINSPDLLILDEPTIGLDPKSRHTVWESLEKLKSEGITIILSTHYMEEAERLCDRVAIMNCGKISVIDSPSTLIIKYGDTLESVYLKITGKSF
ncbi:MAG: ATP-binding cassette domain-containing protein [Thermodesulfovibrionales bacterium]|nr:ATP-binding cassette domain-containing protein [Thermodesulfovibrionales bacterium]